MAYTPTTWNDGSAPDIDAANLNHLENGVQAAAATADAAVPAPASPASNDAMVWNGSAWTHAKIANANVDAAAAIAYSKLALGNSIVNADIASAAAIAASKLASYPSDGTKFLAGDGTWKAAGSTTYRKTTSAAATNTITETDLLGGGITVGAGALGTTGVLRLTMWGDWVQNSGAGQNFPRFKLKLGAGPTVVLDTNAAPASQAANSASRFGWRVVAEVANLGVANSQWCSVTGRIAAANTGDVAATAAFTTGEGRYLSWGAMGTAWFDGCGSAAIDTTAAMAVLFTVINPSATTTETKLFGALAEVV